MPEVGTPPFRQVEIIDQEERLANVMSALNHARHQAAFIESHSGIVDDLILFFQTVGTAQDIIRRIERDL